MYDINYFQFFSFSHFITSFSIYKYLHPLIYNFFTIRVIILHPSLLWGRWSYILTIMCFDVQIWKSPIIDMIQYILSYQSHRHIDYSWYRLRNIQRVTYMLLRLNWLKNIKKSLLAFPKNLFISKSYLR